MQIEYFKLPWSFYASKNCLSIFQARKWNSVCWNIVGWYSVCLLILLKYPYRAKSNEICSYCACYIWSESPVTCAMRIGICSQICAKQISGRDPDLPGPEYQDWRFILLIQRYLNNVLNSFFSYLFVC